MFKTFLKRAAGLLAIAAIALFTVHQVSPWPSALFYRTLMDMGGTALNAGLAKHVPDGVAERRNHSYDQSNPDAMLDVYFPLDAEKSDRVFPTIVWIHGGGFLSGSKDQVANYAKILAAKGYTVASLNYSLAPSAQYPEPVKQINAAIAYLLGESAKLRIDPAKMFLAGDSAGAQLAGQTAALISSPEYAAEIGIKPALARSQLRGVILHCGLYDPELLQVSGNFAGFLQTVGWSYFGAKDFLKSPLMKQFSVAGNVTRDYPPVFITVGNADPLKSHSQGLAAKLKNLGVPVDELFFPDSYEPPLPHEYQFNLDTEAGKLALERTLNFLRTNAP